MVPENSFIPGLTWIAFRSAIKVELGESDGWRAPLAWRLMGRDGLGEWILSLDGPEIPIHLNILFLRISGEVLLTPKM